MGIKKMSWKKWAKLGRDKLIKTNTIIHLAKRISDLDFAEIRGNLEK